MTPLRVQRMDARYATFNSVAGDHNVHGTMNQTNPLDVLPYAEGASWNPEHVCFQGTRKELFHDIQKWIYSADENKPAEVFWLCDVAGAGKSAIAHTVSQECYHAGVLASSFFFDRNIPDRRSPAKLFSTIARDLVRLSSDLAGYMSQILENDRSIASAGQSRQFDELILSPVNQYQISGPVVIVIDALDEGCDRVTLSILRNKVSKLPGTFRIFVTSRPIDEIHRHLRSASHVRYRSLDIQSDINQRDITMYIRERMVHISSWKQLPADWPGEQRIRDLTEQAEGLFIWIYTVCESLGTALYPDRKLSKLLNERNLACLGALAKINALYAEVLSDCKWSDEDFVHDYELVIGSIVAAKTPLSASALQSLHREHPTLEVNEVLPPLSSVLTGVLHEDHPIQVLHLSFRDFLTHYAQLSPARERFHVNERKHSQRLAHLCLRVMNEDLTSDIPGTGYLSGLMTDTEGIPPSPGSQVPEVLWYACRFWAEHIIEVEGSDSDAFFKPLRQFLSQKLTTWLEVLNSRYQFQGLRGVREWIQKRTFPSEPALIMAISGRDYSRTLIDLSKRLTYLGRREDALEAILEAVDLRRRRAGRRANFNADLAVSLNSLSNRFAGLGRHEEALKAILEAVDLYRRLAEERPAAFNAHLAGSLNNLSRCLSDLGCREEALKAILEAVDLLRRLAEQPAVVFNADLALSLNNLSIHLSDLGRQEEALKAILEAVDLYRRLANERSAVFNAHLARSLNNFSNRLSVRGRREEALKAILEAVDIRRQLAKEQPAAFNADLALSLNNLSARLSDLEHREEALKAIREAVDLYRQLAEERPAAFNADLALSLNNLSNGLSNLGCREEALKAILEAVGLRRQLAKERPAAFNADLARSLNNLSPRLLDLGRQEEALKAILEAVDLRRQLAEEQPAAFKADLARSLTNLSVCLSHLGQQEEASKAMLEKAHLEAQ